MNNLLKGVGQAAVPVLGTPPHPCPRLPTEGLNADSNAIPCHAQNHTHTKKSTSLASGIISQTKDQTQEVEKKSHGSSLRTSKDKEEKKITKRL